MRSAVAEVTERARCYGVAVALICDACREEIALLTPLDVNSHPLPSTFTPRFEDRIRYSAEVHCTQSCKKRLYPQRYKTRR